MKNYNQSDYALNVNHSDEIRYRSATGKIISLTEKDFVSEEEFRKWKDFSDENYHIDQNAVNADSYWTTCIDFIEETDIQAEEAHDVISEREEDAELLAREVRKILKECLTETQLRRLIQSVVYGMTQEQIAQLEGNRQQSVNEGILTAKKKVKKYFEKKSENSSKTPCKNAPIFALSERVNFIKLQHQKMLDEEAENKESKKES